MILGIAAVICACAAAVIRFSLKKKQEEQALYDEAAAQLRATALVAQTGLPAMA